MMVGFHSNNMWRKLLKVRKFIHEKRMHKEIYRKRIQLTWIDFPGCTMMECWGHGKMAHPGAAESFPKTKKNQKQMSDTVILRFDEKDSVWIMPDLMRIIYVMFAQQVTIGLNWAKNKRTSTVSVIVWFSCANSSWSCTSQYSLLLNHKPNFQTPRKVQIQMSPFHVKTWILPPKTERERISNHGPVRQDGSRRNHEWCKHEIK